MGKMNKLIVIIGLIATTFIWWGFQSETVNATGEVQTGVDFTGVNLKGVKLLGTIFSKTTMPDGTTNNTDSDN